MKKLTQRASKESFFDLFVAQASTISQAADSLLEMAETLGLGQTPSGEKAAGIKALEERGDDICHRIYDKLDKTFITPTTLDEEDIRALARSLDNILDMIEKASSRVVVFGVQDTNLRVRQLASLLQRIVKSVETLAIEFGLGLSRRLAEMCVETHRHEEEMDRLYRGALTELFHRDSYHDLRELVAWKDIYETIESAADCCHDAVVVEGILSKNKII